MLNSTKIIKNISILKFKELIKNNTIIVDNHALDRLSEGQRKIFKEEDLINILSKETPKGVGLQANYRYCAYFKKKNYYIKIIFYKDNSLHIATFMNLDNIPNFKRI